MVTLLVLFQLFIVLALIFIGARVGGIGLGIYGMVGVFILVFIFGMHPGKLPIDVMLIIVSVITATAALQAAGGLDYLVGLAANFLRKHPTHITYYGPLTTWLFCLVAGTAHTSYSLLPTGQWKQSASSFTILCIGYCRDSIEKCPFCLLFPIPA